MRDIPEKLARKPETWSHMERAVTMHNFICTDPLAYETWKSTHPQLFGIHDMSGVAAPAWMEGFMVALAFCSGAVSGGKLREFARIIDPHLDTFGLNKFAESAMASQYIWDKQEEPE